MKKINYTILGAVLAMLVLGIVATFATAENALQQRIAKADGEFQQILKQAPNKEVGAVAFFTNDMTLDELQSALLKNRQLKVKGFRHGTASYTGGYTFRKGEKLSEAIESYQRDHLLFLEKRMELEGNALQAEEDPALKGALKQHLSEASQVKTDFEKNGLRIVGVELEGRARDIENFKKQNTFVRVIELKKQGRPQPAILPKPKQ